ncbi:MAG: response regulator [Anaerolineales bacterium]|nr:MAG: response regulator [Anaerolineales bacterium]
MSPIILLIDHDVDSVEETKRILEMEGYQVLSTVTGQAGLMVAQLRRPSLVLVETDLPDVDGYEVCRALRGMPPTADVPIIIHSGRDEVADKVAGFRAGATDYIVKPSAGAELIARIKAALRTEEQPLAHIVALWGTKGGVGTTTLAANLAVALRSTTNKRVTLVDASVLGGTLEVLLNLSPIHTMEDLLPRLDNLDSELLTSVLAQHSSGVKVLLSPPQSTNGSSLQPSELDRILVWLQQANDYVILDTSPSLDPMTLRVLQLSHQVIAVLTPEMTSLRNARLFLSMVETWEQAPENLALVINRYPVKGGLRLKDIEAALQKKITAQIPNDEPLVTYSINRGIPVFVSHRHSPVARSFLKLAQTLVNTAEQKPRESLLSSVLGRRS